MLDSVVEAKKKYYPQTFLKECKYEIKRLKWRTLLMMNYNQAPLMMNLIMNLKSHLEDLTVGQTMMNLTMNKMLKVRSEF